MYSVTTSMKPDTTLQQADPQIMTAKFPYKWKGRLFGKPYLVTFAPGYESLDLNANGTGGRENLLKTTLVSTEQTFIVSDDYFTSLKLDWRGETATTPSSTIDDATKVTVGNTNILFRDAKKTEAVLFNWSYMTNTTEITSSAFNKLELSGGYLTPVFQKTSWTTMLAASQSTYNKSTTNRKDTNLNFNTSLSAPVYQKIQGAAALSYETNTSNVETSTYNKYTLTGTLTWALDF
jgi:hypothetical protein